MRSEARTSGLAGAVRRVARTDFHRKPTGLELELETALRAIEAGFHVRLIATFDPELVWAPVNAPAAEWLVNHPGFDQFPVKDGDAAVGLLIRGAAFDRKTVREAMQALHDRMIVSADTPLTDLIPELCDGHCRLVLRGDRINGLVTQSDLLKLPVRMLLFGLITHLEICLRAFVRSRVRWPEWLERISHGPRRRQMCREFDTARDARLDPDPLEFTNFHDLIDVLKGETLESSSSRTWNTSGNSGIRSRTPRHMFSRRPTSGSLLSVFATLLSGSSGCRTWHRPRASALPFPHC